MKFNPATSDVQYTDQEREFMVAMDRYIVESKRKFPTWSEVLEVLRSLGYRQVEDKGPLPKFGRCKK